MFVSKDKGLKPLIIVGIDPGTTLAYAVLDLYGNVLRISSSKQSDINSLTANVFYIGKPLVVATDVNPVPKFVEKFAAETGSKVICPRQSLKVYQKNELTKNYSCTNDHECDALAAAILAFKKIRALLKKISIYLKRRNKEALKREVTQLVFSKGMSISDAIASLEKKEVIHKVGKPKLRTEPIKTKFDETKYLREQNEKLKDEINHLEDKIKNLKLSFSSISERKVEDLLNFKDKKLVFLNKEIREYKTEIEKLNKKVISLKNLLLNSDKYFIAPKFKSLSFDEVENKELKNVIFVEDPGIFSEKTLELLKGKVSIIIYSKPASKNLLNKFVFVSVKNLEIIMEDEFVLVEKSRFEEEKNKINLLAKVVEEYKQERE